MSAKNYHNEFIKYWHSRCRMLLQERNNLNREDLEYVIHKVENMKDERLKQCIATLIGWGDDERSELETFCAISLRVMTNVNPSRIREAAKTVELKYHLHREKE